MLLTIRLAAMAGLVVFAAGFAAVLVLRLKGIWYPPLLPEAGLGVLLAVSLVAALLWPLPDHLVASSADRRLRLCDRLGTAAQLVGSGEQSGMEQAVVADAVAHVRRVRPRDAYPLRAYRSTKAAAASLAALLLVQVLPIPPLLLSPREREERSVLKREAAKIISVARKLEQESKKGADLEGRKVARRLQKLARQLNQGRLDKKHALLSLKEMEKELSGLEKKALPPALKTAEKAAQELAKAAREDLASKASQLAEQAAKQGKQQEAKKLQDVARRAQEAKEPGELKSLAAQLEQQAKALGVDVTVTPEVTAMLSEALSGEDWEQALRDLDKLQDVLDKLAKEATPEQLREAAKQLEELAEILKDTDLKELSECLMKAAECLKAGDCEGAKKLLAEGLKECEGKLAALRLAKAAGECEECVGMAAAAVRGEALAEATRSGALESEMGRGGPAPQERIPPDAPAASLYAPRTTETSGSVARVPGQVRPQGEMMAVTEKGAPVKVSESRVPYYEVLPEYSKAAEEALAREEVPPAYRTTVREYFKALQSGTKP